MTGMQVGEVFDASYQGLLRYLAGWLGMSVSLVPSVQVPHSSPRQVPKAKRVQHLLAEGSTSIARQTPRSKPRARGVREAKQVCALCG